MRLAIIVAMTLTIPSFALAQTTWYVPDHFQTIQGAVSDPNVMNGDMVIVRPGTYVENIDFLGKAITLKSESGPEATIIDGNDTASVVTFQSGEGPDSVLDGFTLTNGYGNNDPVNGSAGGGVYCFQSYPLITKCTIKENEAGNSGGGIYCGDNANPAITANLIMNNTSGQAGGGIYCNESSPDISGNIITGNSAASAHTPAGGGIYLYNSHPSITNNLITDNSTCIGGGMYNYYSNPTVSSCTFSNNTAGGMYNSESSPTITNCTFSGYLNFSSGMVNSHGNPTVTNCTFSNNSSSGMTNSESSPLVTNCIFSGNSAFENGGGMFNTGGSPTVTNCILFGNSARNGGGIHNNGSVTCLVTNTVFWNNNALEGPEIFIGYQSDPSALTISYSDVKGGKASVYVDSGCTLNWGPGMIDSDPLFVDPSNKDFHLTFNSPCRGSGDNSAVTEPSDFESDPRIAYGTVDMGADEFYTHLYCMGDFTPTGSIECKLVGLPGSSPVGLFIGTNVLDPPMMTAWGSFYLQPPWYLIPLVPIPGNGVLMLPATIPATPPASYDLPMQVLIGLNPDSLTNLWVLEVR